jgi:large subunit ribosomal protein L24
MHVRKGDTVYVLRGEYAGNTGKVLAVLTKTNRVLVEGINVVKKHVRPNRRNPRGGRIEKEAPIAVANVAPVDVNGNWARVGYEERDGKKVRVNRRKQKDANGNVMAGTLIADPPIKAD